MDPGDGGVVRLPIEDHLDLHPFSPRDVSSVVTEYLDGCRSRYAEVRLIHGRGVGVQRETVRAILARRTDVAEFFDAEPSRGGWGATVVVFRAPEGGAP